MATVQCRRSTELCEANDAALAYVLSCAHTISRLLCPLVEVAFFCGPLLFIIWFLAALFRSALAFHGVRLKMIARSGIMCAPFAVLESLFSVLADLIFWLYPKVDFLPRRSGRISFFCFFAREQPFVSNCWARREKSNPIRILTVRCTNETKTWIEQLLDRQFHEHANEDHSDTRNVLDSSNGTQRVSQRRKKNAVDSKSRYICVHSDLRWGFWILSVDFISMQPRFLSFMAQFFSYMLLLFANFRVFRTRWASFFLLLISSLYHLQFTVKVASILKTLDEYMHNGCFFVSFFFISCCSP